MLWRYYTWSLTCCIQWNTGKNTHSRMTMYVNEALYDIETFHFFFTESTENGSIQLKTDHRHRYYDQVQGQLHIGNFNSCDFVVKTNIDMVIIRIQKDMSWSANIRRLHDFFFDHFLQYIEN